MGENREDSFPRLLTQVLTSIFPSFKFTLAWLKHELSFKKVLSLAMVVISCILH